MRMPSGLLLLLLLLSLWRAAPAGEGPLVAVVFGERTAEDEPQGQPSRARACCQAAEDALRAAGVAYVRLADPDVQAGRLRPYRAAVLPYNLILPAPEVAALEQYVQDGGRLVVFGALHDRLAELLSLNALGQRKAARPDEFATIRFRDEGVQGLPEAVRLDSAILYRAQPAAPQALALGEWHDAAGRRTGLTAAYVGPRGAYLAHEPARGDLANRGRMLLAILGHLVPDLWRQVSAAALDRATRVGGLASLDELGRRVAAAPLPPAARRAVERALADARDLAAEAYRLAQAGKHAQALDTAIAARRRATDAFLHSSAERQGELRAAWLPSPEGLGDLGWPGTARRFRDAAFNALFVNLLGAGVASYPSEMLPVAPAARARGDLAAQCLRACARHGLQLHLWMTCCNLSQAPASFTDALAAEGRLARRRDGTELLWLCPSDPRNLELGRDALLEAVRSYAIHGIHLDYVHYPDAGTCLCDGCRERFQEATDTKVAKWPDDVLEGPQGLRERFAAWRREQLTRLVRTLAIEARRARPGIIISAAVFPDIEAARATQGQDWRRWLDERLLDFVCPLDYASDAAQLAPMVARQVELANSRVPVCVGIAAHRTPDPADLLAQLEGARGLGADGFVLYAPDAEVIEEHLVALGRSHAVTRTAPPWPAPVAQFAFPPGLSTWPGLAYGEGAPVAVTALVAAKGNYSKPVRAAAGVLRVETTNGVVVQEVGRVSSGDKAPAGATLRLPPGRYRLAVEGSVSFGWFRGQPFLVRSRPFEIVRRGAEATGP